MKRHQIEVRTNHEGVNNWLDANRDKEIMNISFAVDGKAKTFVIHYVEEVEGEEDGK